MEIVDNYDKLRQAGIRDQGPCTVVTWANVFNCSFHDAKSYLTHYGYGIGSRGMSTEQVVRALSDVRRSTVVEGPYSKSNRITLGKFIERHKEGRYYLLVRGHALAVIDGVLYDHSEKPRREVIRAFRVYLGREGGFRAYKEKR